MGFVQGEGDLTKVRVSQEKVFRVIGSSLCTGHLRGDGENRNTAALAIVQAIDEVEFSRLAVPRTERKLACDLRLPSQRRRLILRGDRNPVDHIVRSDRFSQAVERVVRNSIDALDSGLPESFRS